MSRDSGQLDHWLFGNLRSIELHLPIDHFRLRRKKICYLPGSRNIDFLVDIGRGPIALSAIDRLTQPPVGPREVLSIPNWETYMSHWKVRCSSAWRSKEELREINDRAVAIRKMLRHFQGRMPRGVMTNALQLVGTIESLARFGQVCTADEAVEITSLVHTLVCLLGNEIDNLLDV